MNTKQNSALLSTIGKTKDLVGRVVSVKKKHFEEILQRGRKPRVAVENLFIVAAATSNMRKLVCYGADTRIEVNVSDVVFI